MQRTILALLLLAAAPALSAEPEKCRREGDDQILRMAVESALLTRSSSAAIIDLLERENARLKAELAAAQALSRGAEAK